MTSLMRTEALSSPAVVDKLLEENQELFENLSQFLNQKNPYSTISIARGSSDHAAQYLNFLISTKLGRLTTSLSMSALTLYQAELDVRKSVAIAISQSGLSPDLINSIKYMNSKNAPTLVFTNNIESPLAKAAKWTIPLHAGPEKSVAATKSFIASLASSAKLVASWKNDAELTKGLYHLSDDLIKAQALDWTAPIEVLKKSKRIMVVGRGIGLSLALEAALKFKETCGIQAEAFSAAEIKHGPQALISEGYPILIFANRGPALHTLLDLADDLKSRGAHVILAAPPFIKTRDLEIKTTHAEELDVITAIQSFYLLAEELSRSLGFNPDQPKHLLKETKTT